MARASLLLAVVLLLASAEAPAALGVSAHARAPSHRARSGAGCGHRRNAHGARRPGGLSFHRRRCASRRASGRAGSRPGGAAGRDGTLVVPAANGSCPDERAAPTRSNAELIRVAVVCLVNRERIRRHEAPLRWSGRITRAAQLHTESMAFGDYFGHIGPAGSTPPARLRQAGYIYSPDLGYEIGENLGWGTLSLGTPAAMLAAWMASPGHRANILDAGFRDTGVGVSPNVPASLSSGQPGGIYTQDFGVTIS